jgi:hypothetical protein
MPKNDLEAQLTSLTREFVGKLVHAIRNASFAEVAALPGPASAPLSPQSNGVALRTRALAKAASRPGRQTAERRAQLGEQILHALRSAGHPLGVRALASGLGVPADLLATPLRELRVAGKIKKHGEKRATTYSL